jgi:hypothetical protein
MSQRNANVKDHETPRKIIRGLVRCACSRPHLDQIRPHGLDDRFHETHPIGCHHSSLVNLACRSYILVIRSWSACLLLAGTLAVAPLPRPMALLEDSSCCCCGSIIQARSSSSEPNWLERMRAYLAASAHRQNRERSFSLRRALEIGLR